MPYNVNKKFVGRRELFFNQNCPKIALFGLGWISKTQLAIEFAYQVKNSYPEYSTFWVSALSAEAFRQSYNNITIECDTAVDPKIEDLWYGMKRYLHSEILGKWSMIVDNADDKDLLHGSEAWDEEFCITYQKRKKASFYSRPGMQRRVKQLLTPESFSLTKWTDMRGRCS